jgi:dTDP-glucose 4,6-dehydratase
MIFERNILLTGAAGFIGSHAAIHFVKSYPQYRVIILDKLTYAGNLENLEPLGLNSEFRIPNSESEGLSPKVEFRIPNSESKKALKSDSFPNVAFVEGDICDAALISRLFAEFQIDGVMHLAAESHVDRSIENPMEFVMTNVVGTVNLLNAAVKAWGEHADRSKYLFYHISTDEVYGSLGAEGYFTEDTPYDPRSPYSASKASSDHFVRAYHETYGLPVVISNCSNNYGPNQYPEKLIPVVINSILHRKPIPVYGKGENIRDWLFVGDHVSAMDAIWQRGQNGRTYNVGGNNEWKNIELVQKLCRIMDTKLGRAAGESESLITYVTDRKGHDLRYAIDASRLRDELHWEPKQKFDEYLSTTVDYYLALFGTTSEINL